MKQSLTRCVSAFIAAIGLGVAAPTVVGQTATTRDAQVDKIFARWTDATPGCAVAASVAGRPVLSKAYGLADLEHDVKNSPETIFEAGSVSKQFTAAAVLMLAREGKLSLDDPVRKHIPELPDYNAALTIRHMLNHTSGLRDWGSVAGIGGWPRTSRAYSHAHVLEIVSRQRALNFTPGTRYSYSNTGFNLAAVIVSRVSGMSFAEFSQQRIFGPVGMTHTSWRDDHQRIVKGRAMAYSESGGTFRTLMPFENVHGNGGLLTTVGDLLKWNQNFTTHAIGDAAFAREQETAGQFTDGRAHGYALGLMVGNYKGVRTVEHSGSTAGYRAHLSRYPEQQLSVAVLCNASAANATQYSNAVADLYLGDRARQTAAPTPSHVLTANEQAAVAGLYKNTITGEATTVTATQAGIEIDRSRFVPVTLSRFVSSTGSTWEFNDTSARLTDRYGTVDTFERTTPVAPSPAQLQELVGVYTSEEAETALNVVLEDGTIVIRRRPDAVIRLAPSYPDAFTGQIGTVIFRRSGNRVTGLSISQDRVWDMRFTRQTETRSTQQP